MKYTNANSILPKELIEQIQEYVQGEYLYIPIKNKCAVEPETGYKTELEKRNAHIFTNYLEGMGNKRLAEMYHLSESSIRRIIIKQRKGYARMNRQIKDLLFHWGLENSEVKQIYSTTWQVGDGYVLKVYQDEEMLRRNLKILHILNEMSIPVGQIVPASDGAQFISADSTFYFLSRKLTGSNIVQIGDIDHMAFKMGEIIANLHIAFKKCEDTDVFWNNSLLDEMNGWVKKGFEDTGWKYVSKDEYEAIVAQLTNIYGSLPVQLIHRDVHFGNFLFEGGEFSGYIDFDLSQRNIRIFDLCYFLLGLLSEEEKFDITNEQWFEFVKGVFRGYRSKLELSRAEIEAVPYVMECIELLFVSYFEGIDDLCCAQNAYKIFAFVRKQENRILKSVI